MGQSKWPIAKRNEGNLGGIPSNERIGEKESDVWQVDGQGSRVKVAIAWSFWYSLEFNFLLEHPCLVGYQIVQRISQ